MKRRSIVLIAVVLLLCLAFSATAKEIFVPRAASLHKSAAIMGMGGLTVVNSSAGSHAVFYNPALLSRHNKFRLELLKANIQFGDDVMDLIDFVDQHQDDFANFEGLSLEEQSEFLKDSEQFDDKWQGLGFNPFFLGLTMPVGIGNLGVAGYMNTNVNLKIDQGVFVPSVATRAYADLVGGVGFGFKKAIMERDFHFGFTGRFVDRRDISYLRMKAADMGQMADVVTTVTDSLSDSNSGFAIDVGAIHSMRLGVDENADPNLDLGLSIRDLISSLDGMVKPNVSAGAMYMLPYARSAMFKMDAGLEFTDIFNRDGVNFMQKINAGLQISTFLNRIHLRGGMHQGYGTVGFGLNLFILDVNVAYYGQELGTSPGQVPDNVIAVDISLGLLRP